MPRSGIDGFTWRSPDGRVLRLRLEELESTLQFAEGEIAPLGCPAPLRAGRDALLPPRTPTTVAPPEVGGIDPLTILDHPLIGGRLTVFVLCYGPHAELAKRCIDSICRTLPPERLDLRVAMNAPCAETVQYVQTIPASRAYVYAINSYKYPVMREIFRDPVFPVRTPYFVWFDDDSYVVDDLWAVRLAESIITNHPKRVRLYGIRFCHDLARLATTAHDPRAWFRAARWFRGFELGSPQSESPAPGGSVIHFVTGGFWAMATEMIRIADIPDERLRHNGGDITIGEQIRQAGYRMVSFNHGKALVHSSGSPRRGFSEAFPWVAPAS